MDTNETYQKLIDHFREYVDLAEIDIDRITSKFEIIYIKKKDYLLRAGQISNHMRFIVKGSLYVYTLDEKGKECVNQLGFEDWWINDLYSYLRQKPSEMYIQANEESIIIRISKKDLDILFKEVPAVSEFWRLKIQNAYVLLQERIFGNTHIDAFTKYKAYVTKYPNIEQRFPQYMIASYLGITVEYLSYLRKKHLSDLF
ncbi:MAG: Crp/Fnr family transcriptional regulator [Sphingobacterium sp.]|jgi:CRP-like cAMP-binding protein|uniref:Crp/Fnr family transcriptional regulator n=1 Tax=Sphingobacterium sp. TaxID=341027 RepID=UPI0028485F14|nr:Crp/Fnr family transcriptional regulator [Sphingobacterium sp.]MDR3006811.1 Crp/Fnr family transcriptional regulator [Sphingobacterium sp.]